MKRYFIHNALFRILAPAIYGVLIYLLVLLINNNVAQVEMLFESQEVYLCIGLTYLCFESVRLVIILQEKILKDKYPRLRILIQFVITTLLSLALVTAGLSLYFEYVVGFSISGTQLLIFMIIYAISALVYNTLYFSHYYLQKENTLKLTAEKQQREVLETEILEFRNDINPDLLYEGLENLITLMYRDVDKAENHIDALATAYRYVLTNRQQELVPVAAELEACRNLVVLLNERFNGQLRFEHALSDADQQLMLIPGSLPVIIEHLARNTIFSRYEPLTLSCYREDDYITVQSKLNDKLMIHSASQVALERLQKSYALYSDKPMIKVKAYDENYIKLPVIEIVEEAVR
jgi:sensor histidine kinase YesM